MTINPIIGIESNGKIISESEFEQHNILSTKLAIEEYFAKYGYTFVDIYDLENNLIIVQDKNFEVSMLLGMFYKSFRVIDFVTGEVVDSKVTPDSFGSMKQPVILSFKYRIQKVDGKSKLISSSDGSVIVEADFIVFLSAKLVLFRKYNIEYIMDVNTLDIYPLIKKEYSVYQGPTPEKFIDFRNGMYYQNQRCIFPIDISKTNVDYLINTFPYGEKKDRLFFLLDNPVRYGIRYENSLEDEIWYDTEDERDLAYNSIKKRVLGLFEEEKQKKYKK